MKTTRALMALAVTLTIGLVGCGGDDQQELQEASLRTDVMPLLGSTCGGCHTRTNPPVPAAVANMVYLEEPADLMGLVGTFIVAGDSANSGFIKVLEQEMGVGSGPTMMPPPPATAMGSLDVDLVARWIDEGAKDN